MNIFLPSPNPRESARALDDKRVPKMVVETAQLLSTAVHHLHPDNDFPIYKPAYDNHPCSLFARYSERNFKFLAELGLELSEEYSHRWGPRHKSHRVIEDCVTLMFSKPSFYKPFYTREFSLNFNCSGYDTGSIYKDYRLCLIDKWKKQEKKGSLKWTDRKPPDWWS